MEKYRRTGDDYQPHVPIDEPLFAHCDDEWVSFGALEVKKIVLPGDVEAEL